MTTSTLDFLSDGEIEEHARHFADVWYSNKKLNWLSLEKRTREIAAEEASDWLGRLLPISPETVVRAVKEMKHKYFTDEEWERFRSR